MFSMCSELTPHAPIPDGRMAQFMQPCRPIAICFLSFFSFWLEHLGACQRYNMFWGEWLVLIVQPSEWLVGWLTPWTVPTMTVPPPLALKQQVKRKRRMNRTIRRKAGLSCGIIPEALFIITARRAPSHRGLFRLPLAGSTQIKLAFCRTKTGQR